MTALTYLANLCCKIDKNYKVSLEYGAHAGDVPCWQMRVAIPLRYLFFTRDLVRGDDAGANLEAARSLGKDIKRAAPWAFREESDAEILSLDTHKLT